MIGNTKVTFDLEPKPVMPMKALQFIVTTENLPVRPNRMILDLTMPGMEMGVNQVVLEKTDSGVYAGRGIIVKCPKGGKLWKAEVWIPKFGEVEYLFVVQ